MWKESKLYQNLVKLYGEDNAQLECERLLKEKKEEIIFEMKEGEIVKNYETLKYFGFDTDKYIDDIIKSDLYEENDEIIQKIQKKVAKVYVLLCI